MSVRWLVTFPRIMCVLSIDTQCNWNDGGNLKTKKQNTRYRSPCTNWIFKVLETNAIKHMQEFWGAFRIAWLSMNRFLFFVFSLKHDEGFEIVSPELRKIRVVCSHMEWVGWWSNGVSISTDHNLFIVVHRAISTWQLVLMNVEIDMKRHLLPFNGHWINE